jgi:hypothetical protein
MGKDLKQIKPQTAEVAILMLKKTDFKTEEAKVTSY